MLSKRKIIIIVIVLITIIAIAVASIVYISSNKRNSYGGELQIANLDEVTNGRPSDQDTLEYIKYDLYRVVNKNNTPPVESNSIKDILIRENSFQQNQDTIKGVNDVSFIVDIESLKQSYLVSYQWSIGKDRSNLDEWGTVVKCLPIEQLIYGDFNCKDMFIELDSPSDPILKHLPYSTADYSVVLDPSTEKTLKATIRTTAADERFNSDLAIKKYKADLNDWITSIGLNPADYKINYTIIRASLY